MIRQLSGGSSKVFNKLFEAAMFINSACSIIIIFLLLITQNSFSEIYKWVDKNGHIKFSDKKPVSGNKTKTVKVKINTVKVPKIYHNGMDDDYASDEKSTSGRDDIISKNVIMYSASWCGVCSTAKKYFKHKGIPYKEYDVETSAKGRKDFKRLRGKGVPIILIGKKRMDGFDQSYFERLN